MTDDPLIEVMSKHIWFTTQTRGGSTFVLCKCRTRCADADDHAAHVTRVARNFIRNNG